VKPLLNIQSEMGSGASAGTMASIASLPLLVDKELCLSSGISEEDFVSSSTDSRNITREAFLKLVKITDVFLSHDWGLDELGRNNHERVSKLNTALKNCNILTWFDSGRYWNVSQVSRLTGTCR